MGPLLACDRRRRKASQGSEPWTPVEDGDDRWNQRPGVAPLGRHLAAESPVLGTRLGAVRWAAGMPLGVAKGSEALLSLPLAKRPSEHCCCLRLTRREFQSASSQPSQRTQKRRQPGWPDSAARSPAVAH